MMAASKKQTQKKYDDKYIEKIMNKVPEGRLQLLMIAVPKISHCWKEIGIQLHFTREELETIDRGIHPQNVEDCCKEMLLLWKDQTKASADILIYAIKEAGNAAYAEDLKKEVARKVDILDDTYLTNKVTRRIAVDWDDVGLYLKIKDSDLSTIRACTNPVGARCKEMLRQWLQRDESDPNKSPTWKNMYRAMMELQMVRAGEQLQDDIIQSAPDIN
ncbi:uncharacterized protein [Dysidea avara]|uniref:uncharacterized protein n=1 Tax=Dysidea avara TaxID=196820 RepID=UPI00331F8267